MPVPIGNALGIFADNSRLRKSVLPLPGGKVPAWAGGLGLPAGGETVLYTGQMYQLVPTINAMSRRLAKFEDAWITRYFGVGRKVNRLINLSAFIARADPAEQRDYDGRLRNIARLLRAAGVEFGYVSENDLYSGALVYDEGLDDVLAPHAGLVYRALKSGGVKRLITVDPHTTSLLRTVYPRVVPGFDIEVKSYLEVLAERPPDPAGRREQEHTQALPSHHRAAPPAAKGGRCAHPGGRAFRQADAVLRRPAGVAVPTPRGRARRKAHRAAGGLRRRDRNDVPDLPGQSKAGRPGGYNRAGYLGIPD